MYCSSNKGKQLYRPFQKLDSYSGGGTKDSGEWNAFVLERYAVVDNADWAKLLMQATDIVPLVKKGKKSVQNLRQ